MKKKILIVAGEASGDLHGGNLIKSMRRRASDLEFIGIAGDSMRKAGAHPVYHSSEVAFMGYIEVIKHLPFIRRMMRDMIDIVQNQTLDLIILIDYPGFNLRFAKKVRKFNQDIPIFYYISPQVWAWNKSRASKMAKWIDRIAVIFPFEVDIYKRVGLDAHFVGHPLLEILDASNASSSATQDRELFCQTYGLDPSRPILGMLPGSRRQEIRRLLPVMLESALAVKREIPDLQFTLSVAPTLSPEFIKSYLIDSHLDALYLKGCNYDLIRSADVMLVKSGTSTLETGIIGKPMVIIYKINWLSYLLARLLVKVDHIGMVNVVAGRRIAPELIQHEAAPEKIAPLICDLLTRPDKREAMKKDLQSVRKRLGTPGASERAASLALELIR
ncbi:MAG: lipid-A-disaccharide synthase [Candidatus Cloacimonetes bacterium 4572_55]|nr:MAG: lipid-A-disaccharide synthase [Candidatus Cloacimonetes bacterium 4572_55]